ncbi:hypothetical protein DSO57_1003297 [Entomophthora muscae]|uniref:Uncharacterized protein n=1 Tax=Entomophthora muscae TaxID=34485 RepID=A0ACC2T965_9FUNG|nr:hypothetical protein DSO57_1003297 [Entomophthora muscae]
MDRSPITTHILDTQSGKPANGVNVTLSVQENSCWKALGQGITDSDGRINRLIKDDIGACAPHGIYQLTFDVKEYFESQSQKCFFPKVQLTFEVCEKRHYHVPLLLSPYSYTTYRGS